MTTETKRLSRCGSAEWRSPNGEPMLCADGLAQQFNIPLGTQAIFVAITDEDPHDEEAMPILDHTSSTMMVQDARESDGDKDYVIYREFGDFLNEVSLDRPSWMTVSYDKKTS